MKNSFIQKLLPGLSAGVLISIGGAVFMACENRYVGACMFAVALLCICLKGYYLFTGKIGFLLENRTRDGVASLLIGLLGNAIAASIGGWLLRWAIPAMGETALALCEKKLAQTVPSCFIRAMFCGILMYLAVSIFRDKKTISAILFCVPVFILSGFEHSIADICYFAASGIVSVRAFGYLMLVVLGNSVGALILPALDMAKSK